MRTLSLREVGSLAWVPQLLSGGTEIRSQIVLIVTTLSTDLHGNTISQMMGRRDIHFKMHQFAWQQMRAREGHLGEPVPRVLLVDLCCLPLLSWSLRSSPPSLTQFSFAASPWSGASSLLWESLVGNNTGASDSLCVSPWERVLLCHSAFY